MISKNILKTKKGGYVYDLLDNYAMDFERIKSTGMAICIVGY